MRARPSQHRQSDDAAQCSAPEERIRQFLEPLRRAAASIGEILTDLSDGATGLADAGTAAACYAAA